MLRVARKPSSPPDGLRPNMTCSTQEHHHRRYARWLGDMTRGGLRTDARHHVTNRDEPWRPSGTDLRGRRLLGVPRPDGGNRGPIWAGSTRLRPHAQPLTAAQTHGRQRSTPRPGGSWGGTATCYRAESAASRRAVEAPADVECAVCETTGASSNALREPARGPAPNPARRFVVSALHIADVLRKRPASGHVAESGGPRWSPAFGRTPWLR